MLKKIFFQSTVGTLKFLYTVVRALGSFFTLVFVRPLRFVGSIIFQLILVRLYRIYRMGKTWLLQKLSPAKSKLLFPFTRGIFVHVVILAMAVLVVVNNVSIRELHAEEFGNQSLLSQLLQTNPELEVTEEGASTTPVASGKYTAAVQGSLTPVAGEPAVDEESDVIKSELSGAVVSSGVMAAEPDTPRSKVVYYIVEPGDTISTIAEEFNISTNSILWENRLGPRDYIRPGDKITILPSSGVSHQVKAGETIDKIAKKYSVDAGTIVEYNELADASAIENGDILLIPGGTMPEPEQRALAPQYAYQNIPPPARVEGSKRFLWPTVGRRITQYFRFRHTGIDITGNYSTPVYAADAGVVDSVNNAGRGYGLNVIINHGGGVKTLYAHESKIFVRSGQQVTKGQVIGMIGCTGWCTGPHVHFEVIINGRKVNPLSYL